MLKLHTHYSPTSGLWISYGVDADHNRKTEIFRAPTRKAAKHAALKAKRALEFQPLPVLILEAIEGRAPKAVR